MDDNYRAPLIISAIEMAARNLKLPEDAVFHRYRTAGAKVPQGPALTGLTAGRQCARHAPPVAVIRSGAHD